MRGNDLRLTTARPAKLTACCGPLRRSSGFRIALLAAPSRPDCRDSGTLAAFVPGHSSASATDLHRASLNCKGPNEADCSVVSVGPPPFALHPFDKSAILTIVSSVSRTYHIVGDRYKLGRPASNRRARKACMYAFPAGSPDFAAGVGHTVSGSSSFAGCRSGAAIERTVRRAGR